MSTTMIIEEFEPDVFRQLIEYIHTGCVLLQARTLLGLLNAADYYGLEQLRKACLRFVSCCITVDTVCSLLSTAERYIQYKCTKSIVQKVLEFVDSHANEIFKLNAFGLLPEHVVRLILARDGLQADEIAKYNGVYTWCEHYCRSYELTNMADVMENFLDLIQFHKIPTSVLLNEIYPTHTVPDAIFLSALAYQADPQNFEPQPARQRRMTLPDPTCCKDYANRDDDLISGSNEDNNEENSNPKARKKRRRKSGDSQRHKGPQQQQPRPPPPPTSSSTPQQQSASRKSSAEATGGSPGKRRSIFAPSATPTSTSGPPRPGKAAKLRKGSIAQVSISGLSRLSHKLSIRRKQSHHRQPVGKQQSLVQRSQWQGSPGDPNSKDPLLVGQQILNAYLIAQQEREREEEERKRRELAERRAATEELRRQQLMASGNQRANSSASGSQQQHQHQHQQQVVVVRQASGEQRLGQSQAAQLQHADSSGSGAGSSRRKSFRDFKNISRRIFMRHSSSKTLQQSTSTSSQQSDIANIGTRIYGSDAPTTSTTATTTSGAGIAASTSSSPLAASTTGLEGKRRNLLKIKRSETVFEPSPASMPSPGAKSSSGGKNPTRQATARLAHQLSSNLSGKFHYY